ncbi:hypothetical protein ABZ897_23660 [Nonomuraea sp. NPDC046802]|uniref:hypothetical protein n=1 Tax=Nonomuraea sp. NPDC046802 TaxID=3154919 RepID=UPI00341030C4
MNEPITIDVPAGRATTVAVLNSLSQPISAAARFRLPSASAPHHMDFDIGKLSGPGPGTDLFEGPGPSLFLFTAFDTANGAKITTWREALTPTLADCAAVSPDRWGTEPRWWPPGKTYCLQTSEGGFVLLSFSSESNALGQNTGRIVDYALWRTSPAT